MLGVILAALFALELGIQILQRQSPEALCEFQKAEAGRWWPIIKASGIKAE
jgi:hypothetical protein